MATPPLGELDLLPQVKALFGELLIQLATVKAENAQLRAALAAAGPPAAPKETP